MSERPKDLNYLLGEASSQKTFENMQKLCNQSEYECPLGSGIIYKRKMLKPKDLVELNKLQLSLDADEDPEKRMENIKKQAKICLEGLTDDKWEQTDASLMEIIVGACILISKGFRSV
jgi:hypothetical protein